MTILVTGGTGRLARHLLARPSAPDLSWRILSRRPAPGNQDWVVGDLVTGEGLRAAVTGIDTVLHLASDLEHPANDVRAAEQLVRAARGEAVRHLVFLSIVGVDRIPYPYYRAKLAAEEVFGASGVPCTILRAAQFHSFIDWLLERTLLVPGLILVPAGFKVQSIDDTEVADRLLDVVRSGPGGRVQDLVGPEILRVSDAARTWRRARRFRRAVLPVPLPGRLAEAFRSGANVSPAGQLGRQTWSEWLGRRYSGRR